jgi:hypothetical protein
MNSKYYKLAKICEMKENAGRPQLATIKHSIDEWRDTAKATNWISLITIKEKAERCFPDLEKWIPNISKDEMRKVGVVFPFSHIWDFRPKDWTMMTFTTSDNRVVMGEISTINHLWLDTNLDARMFYDILKGIKDLAIYDAYIYQEWPVTPLYILAENQEVEIKYVLMPLRD